MCQISSCSLKSIWIEVLAAVQCRALCDVTEELTVSVQMCYPFPDSDIFVYRHVWTAESLSKAGYKKPLSPH